MRGWWQDLTDLVLPAECGGCGRPRTVLCPECRAALSGAAPRRVRPVPEPPGLPVVHAAARYADEVRAALLAHKERGALALAGPLGAALAGAVLAGLREAGARVGAAAQAGPREAGAWVDGGVRVDLREDRSPWADGVGFRADGPPAGAPVLLVPVPSARRAVRARGHDPARRIALAAAGELRRTGTPAQVLAVLRQRRAVADQSGLNSRQRLDNLAGALAVAPGCARLLSGGPVVLVDDLMTTGASLAEAARAVRAAMATQAAARGRTAGPGASTGRAGAAPSRGTGGPVPPGSTAGPVTSAGTSGRGTYAGVAGPAAHPGSAGLVPHGPCAAVVYVRKAGEGRQERSVGSTAQRDDFAPAGPGVAGTRGVGGVGDVVCAAVVAASPDAFEINRN